MLQNLQLLYFLHAETASYKLYRWEKWGKAVSELLFSGMFLSVTVFFLSFVFGAFFYKIILDSFILLQLLHEYIVL